MVLESANHRPLQMFHIYQTLLPSALSTGCRMGGQIRGGMRQGKVRPHATCERFCQPCRSGWMMRQEQTGYQEGSDPLIPCAPRAVAMQYSAGTVFSLLRPSFFVMRDIFCCSTISMGPCSCRMNYWGACNGHARVAAHLQSPRWTFFIPFTKIYSHSGECHDVQGFQIVICGSTLGVAWTSTARKRLRRKPGSEQVGPPQLNMVSLTSSGWRLSVNHGQITPRSNHLPRSTSCAGGC